MTRAFEVEIAETVTFRDALGMKARHVPVGDRFTKPKSGADFHRATGQWMQRDLVVRYLTAALFILLLPIA